MAGLLLHVSQTVILNTGLQMVLFGMTKWLHMATWATLPLMQIWFLPLSGKLKAMSLRLQEVMMAVTQLYYKPLPVVFKVEPSDLKSQVMGTFVMVLSGGVTSVVEVVKLVTAVSTKLLQVLNSTVAAAIFRAVNTLGFGVIGMVVMVQWWWLVEEEEIVTEQIMVLE